MTTSTMSKKKPRTARDVLKAESADAWADYLAATKPQVGIRYEEVEPWAWARLRMRLRAIKTRMAALERPPSGGLS